MLADPVDGILAGPKGGENLFKWEGIVRYVFVLDCAVAACRARSARRKRASLINAPVCSSLSFVARAEGRAKRYTSMGAFAAFLTSRAITRTARLRCTFRHLFGTRTSMRMARCASRFCTAATIRRDTSPEASAGRRCSRSRLSCSPSCRCLPSPTPKVPPTSTQRRCGARTARPSMRRCMLTCASRWGCSAARLRTRTRSQARPESSTRLRCNTGELFRRARAARRLAPQRAVSGARAPRHGAHRESCDECGDGTDDVRVVKARSADAAGDDAAVLSPRLPVEEVRSACFGERVPAPWRYSRDAPRPGRRGEAIDRKGASSTRLPGGARRGG